MTGYILFVPALMITFYLSLIFESTGLTLLGFAAALFWVLSFIHLAIIRDKVKVRIAIPMELAERGNPFIMNVEIQNESFLMIGKLRVFVEYGAGYQEKKQRIVLSFRNLPVGKTVHHREITISRSGYFEFATRRIAIHDFLGVFYLNRKVHGITDVMILPKINNVPVRLGEGVKHFYGEAEAYDELLEGPDHSEILGVREFKEGDKLQRVHWKISARMDDLMVKEDSLPKSCPIVLFMPGGDVSKTGSLDFVASLSFTLMDQKCGHYVSWNSRSRNDLVRIRVNDEESYYIALTLFMQDAAAESGNDRLERYREKYKGEPFLHGILVDDDGRISIDDGEPVKLSELREELLLR